MSTWIIPTEPNPNAADHPLAILRKYAQDLTTETKQQFVGVVTDSVREDSAEVFYAFYITAPRLRNYMYRLIEVQVRDLSMPYAEAVTVRLFAKDPRNNLVDQCYSAADLRETLLRYVQSKLAQNILSHLQQLIEIVQDNE